jgi:hypothetical protein
LQKFVKLFFQKNEDFFGDLQVIAIIGVGQIRQGCLD